MIGQIRGTAALAAACTLAAAFAAQAQVECPPDGVPEAEPCGETTNYGCGGEGEPSFEPLVCGEPVCGTVWGTESVWDTDSYEIVTNQPIVITWTVQAEFPGLFGLMATDPPGSGDCWDVTGLDPWAEFNPEELVSITTTRLPAGVYWLWLGPEYGTVIPCGGDNEYVVVLKCEFPADVTEDGTVGIDDLVAVINDWGPCGDPADCPCDCELQPDGEVGIDDLITVINAWGPCPAG